MAASQPSVWPPGGHSSSLPGGGGGLPCSTLPGHPSPPAPQQAFFKAQPLTLGSNPFLGPQPPSSSPARPPLLLMCSESSAWSLVSRWMYLNRSWLSSSSPFFPFPASASQGPASCLHGGDGRGTDGRDVVCVTDDGFGSRTQGSKQPSEKWATHRKLNDQQAHEERVGLVSRRKMEMNRTSFSSGQCLGTSPESAWGTEGLGYGGRRGWRWHRPLPAGFADLLPQPPGIPDVQPSWGAE